MIAVNHHTLCQLIPLTESCNLSFGLIFCFFSSDFSEVTGEKRSSENTPPPHRLHTTSTHSGRAGSAPSSVSLLQLLLCFTQQEQAWGSSQDLSRAGDAFFFFFFNPSHISKQRITTSFWIGFDECSQLSGILLTVILGKVMLLQTFWIFNKNNFDSSF